MIKIRWGRRRAPRSVDDYVNAAEAFNVASHQAVRHVLGINNPAVHMALALDLIRGHLRHWARAAARVQDPTAIDDAYTRGLLHAFDDVVRTLGPILEEPPNRGDGQGREDRSRPVDADRRAPAAPTQAPVSPPTGGNTPGAVPRMGAGDTTTPGLTRQELVHHLADLTPFTDVVMTGVDAYVDGLRADDQKRMDELARGRDIWLAAWTGTKRHLRLALEEVDQAHAREQLLDHPSDELVDAVAVAMEPTPAEHSPFCQVWIARHAPKDHRRRCNCQWAVRARRAICGVAEGIADG